MSKRRALMLGLVLMMAMTSAGCGFDDTYLLWARYGGPGPGGDVWRIEKEFNFHLFPSATSSNRLLCEKALDNQRAIAVKLAEDLKKSGKLFGRVDFVCLPKGMHP